jgi:hypothetical protein
LKRSSAIVLSVLATLLAAVPVATAAPRDRLDVYKGVIQRDDLSAILDLGVDRHELTVEGSKTRRGKIRVEAIISRSQATRLRQSGIKLRVKRVHGRSVARMSTLQAQEGFEVFRRYSGPGGLKEEFEELAADNPRITKLISIGQTHQGQDIVALKITRDADARRDGSKPAAVYIGAQHAREWITPEMNRRLAHYVVDRYQKSGRMKQLLKDTELWIVPVANPDGYDWTFEPDQRLWRKNLRDNNGDGEVSPGDGVDMNRNFPTKWGYDNEGSSPSPPSDTYRGPAPLSEPENQAMDSFIARISPQFFVNYHSAAELLLYGTGWQVATPTPDHVIYEAMAGDDANPAIPGYDPDVSAELYTTNGDTDTHMTEEHGVLGFTPEMSTCETISDSIPDDEWESADCGSGFQFPDDEELVQEEFERNLPFAMSVAESAEDPDDPESVVGREAEDFRPDTFSVSWGDPQTVAVWAKRALRDKEVNWSINGGRTRSADLIEWEGGERYGDENDEYYAEYRAQIRGTDPGDRVKVWFTADKRGSKGRGQDKGKKRGWQRGRSHGNEIRSERFTYTVERDTGADVLVIANEDYAGVNPESTPEAGTNALKYDETHVEAIEAAGYDADVWDVDADGIPHHLSVLSHYDAVVWYLGDNRLTQDPEDFITETFAGPFEDMSVAERQQYLTMSVRDYLNEGGKLIHAGETAQHEGVPGVSEAVGGVYYALNGDDTAECMISSFQGLFEDCLIMANDFRQYWLGGYTRSSIDDENVFSGFGPLEGYEGLLGGPVVAGDNPADELGVYQVTSDVLPVEEFPQFASEGAADYPQQAGAPFAPIEGTRYAAAIHQDASYMRLFKTIDLRNATSAQLRFQLSINTEASYDNVIVEAHTVGQDNWVTLPDITPGRTTETPPAECTGNGFLLQMHPFLRHYLDGQDCTTGPWHGYTSGVFPNGWQQAAVDLSSFAGQQVEVSISYVTDPATGGIGAFVDDTEVVVNGAVTEADGFEGATSTWSIGGPPQGSAPNSGNWRIDEQLVNEWAGTATEDTLLLGFGLEQLATDGHRNELVQRALDNLLGG